MAAVPSWRGPPPHVGGQRCPPLPPVGRRGDSRETRAAGPHVRRQRREAVWRTPGLPSARPAPVRTGVRAPTPPPLPGSLQTQLRRPRRPPPEGRGAFKPKGLSHEESSLPPPPPSPHTAPRGPRPWACDRRPARGTLARGGGGGWGGLGRQDSARTVSRGGRGQRPRPAPPRPGGSYQRERHGVRRGPQGLTGGRAGLGGAGRAHTWALFLQRAARDSAPRRAAL